MMTTMKLKICINWKIYKKNVAQIFLSDYRKAEQPSLKVFKIFKDLLMLGLR